MEIIYRRLEAWGYPVAAIDWLRRRRLLVIVVLAVLSWLCCVGLFFGALFIGGYALEVLGGFVTPVQ